MQISLAATKTNCYYASMKNPAQKLKDIYVSRSAIAAAFGKTNEAIRLWERDGIPTSEALNVERLTDGKISAYDVLLYVDWSKD